MKFEVEARKVKSYNKLRMGQKLCATLSFINILTIYSNYGILNINKYTINLYNLITNLKYPRTSYPRFQFSKHLHLLLSYGHCHLCALVPLMVQVAMTHIFTWKLFQACY